MKRPVTQIFGTNGSFWHV